MSNTITIRRTAKKVGQGINVTTSISSGGRTRTKTTRIRLK